MKNTKLFNTIIAAVALFCMMALFSAKSDAAVYKSSIKSISDDGKVVVFSLTGKSMSACELMLFNVSTNKKVGTFYFNISQGSINGRLSNKTKKNQVYYYKARAVSYDTTKNSFYSVEGWSAPRYFTTITYKSFSKSLTSSKSSVVKFKAPKVKGVQKYFVYISTKEKSGYKKAGTLQPGKSIKLKKCNGKAFKTYKNYYIKVVPRVKNKNAFPILDSFYIYRRWK